jgi:hypothetical protein
MTRTWAIPSESAADSASTRRIPTYGSSISVSWRRKQSSRNGGIVTPLTVCTRTGQIGVRLSPFRVLTPDAEGSGRSLAYGIARIWERYVSLHSARN